MQQKHRIGDAEVLSCQDPVLDGCIPKVGNIALFNGRVRVLAGQQEDLVVRIEAGFMPIFRWSTLFLTPLSQRIRLTKFAFQFLSETTRREVLLGDDANVLQIATSPQLATMMPPWDAMAAIEDKSQVILTLRNDEESEQAVEISFGLHCTFLREPLGFDQRARQHESAYPAERLRPEVGPMNGPKGGNGY